MNYDEVVRGRRSIRGFKKQPVAKETIKEVIDLAMRAPSSRGGKAPQLRRSRP